MTWYMRRSGASAAMSRNGTAMTAAGRGASRSLVTVMVTPAECAPPAPSVSTAQAAATLAAVLPSPVRLRANAPSPYVQLRRDQILAQMRGLGGASSLDQLDNPTAPPGPAAPRAKRKP